MTVAGFRLQGIIEKIPGTHHYRVLTEGVRICLFLTKVNARVTRPAASQLIDGCPKTPNRPIANAMRQLHRSIKQFIAEPKPAT